MCPVSPPSTSNQHNYHSQCFNSLVITIIVFYFRLKKQTIGTVQLTYRIIEMVGCQKSKCSSSWRPIITFRPTYTFPRTHSIPTIQQVKWSKCYYYASCSVGRGHSDRQKLCKTFWPMETPPGTPLLSLRYFPVQTLQLIRSGNAREGDVSIAFSRFIGVQLDRENRPKSTPPHPRTNLPTVADRSWSSLQTSFTDFDCRNEQNFENFAQFNPPPILDQCASRWHSDILLGKPVPAASTAWDGAFGRTV